MSRTQRLAKKTVFVQALSKKRSRPLTRREAMKKRNIHVICEHFEAPQNVARGGWMDSFEILESGNEPRTITGDSPHAIEV